MWGAIGAIGLFPAHAGMNRVYSALNKSDGTVPRTRGDEPLLFPCLLLLVFCSPHTRG